MKVAQLEEPEGLDSILSGRLLRLSAGEIGREGIAARPWTMGEWGEQEESWGVHASDLKP